MKTSIRAALTLGALFAAISAAHAAGSATNQFDVSVTLTSQCKVNNDTTQTVDFGTYDAFQAGAQASVTNADLEFECTRGFAPVTTAFDTVDANSTAAGVGVVQGLQYALSVAAPSSAAGTAATSATIGTGDIVTYTVSGSMPSGQAGACAGASCGPTTQTRVMTLSW